jgi:hypothetical protein
MARQYPFTRTISYQNVTALVFDKDTAEAGNIDCIITPPIPEPAKLAKAVAKKVETATIKFIEVVDVETVEKLYGITSEDFMAHAVELDPKTRKPISE